MAATPTGTATAPRATQIAQIAAQLDAQGGDGAAYTAFADAHPRLSAQQAFDAWAIGVIGQGLGGAVGDAATGVGTATGQIATGTIKGLQLPDFLGELTSRALWVRIIKVIIGMALVVIGVLQLTHASQLIKPAAEAAVLA